MKHFNNEEFRQSFEKVGIESIRAELKNYNKMNPDCQIKALHLLHTMGLLSASLGLNVVEGFSLHRDSFNHCLDIGLTTVYVMNDIARADWDQCVFINNHRQQCVISCLLSAFSHQALANSYAVADDYMIEYVLDNRIKSENVNYVADYQDYW